MMPVASSFQLSHMVVAVDVVEFRGVFGKFVKKSLDRIDRKPSVKSVAERRTCFLPGPTNVTSSPVSLSSIFQGICGMLQ